MSHFTVDVKNTECDRISLCNQTSAAYFNVTWTRAQRRFKTFSKKHGNLLAVHWWQWKPTLALNFTRRLGIEPIFFFRKTCSDFFTLLHLKASCCFQFISYKNISIHLPLPWRQTEYTGMPTGLWGWVEQVKASWATPAQRVIWYANNADPRSSSDRAAIC